MKYKKLLAEQRRDKEKLAQQVNNQRKIIHNLQGRKEMLAEDSNKLFENFRVTIDQDELTGQTLKKRHNVRRGDQEILDCWSYFELN